MKSFVKSPALRTAAVGRDLGSFERDSRVKGEGRGNPPSVHCASVAGSEATPAGAVWPVASPIQALHPSACYWSPTKTPSHYYYCSTNYCFCSWRPPFSRPFCTFSPDLSSLCKLMSTGELLDLLCRIRLGTLGASLRRQGVSQSEPSRTIYSNGVKIVLESVNLHNLSRSTGEMLEDFLRQLQTLPPLVSQYQPIPNAPPVPDFDTKFSTCLSLQRIQASLFPHFSIDCLESTSYSILGTKEYDISFLTLRTSILSRNLQPPSACLSLPLDDPTYFRHCLFCEELFSVLLFHWMIRSTFFTCLFCQERVSLPLPLDDQIYNLHLPVLSRDLQSASRPLQKQIYSPHLFSTSLSGSTYCPCLRILLALLECLGSSSYSVFESTLVLNPEIQDRAITLSLNGRSTQAPDEVRCRAITLSLNWRSTQVTDEVRYRPVYSV